MKIEFLSRFSKDIDKIKNQTIKEEIASIIEFVESASALSDIPQLKKLTGMKNAYRIRIGDYRIGLFYEDGKIEFARVVHRKDIYKIFL